MPYVRQRAPLRPHSTDLAHDLINRRTCVHVDAWLYADENDEHYYLIQWSIAGKETVCTYVYPCVKINDAWALDNPIAITDRVGFDRKYYPRRADSPRVKQRQPWLEQIHRDYVLPIIWGAIPRNAHMFKGYRSIALHYVYTNKDISDPMSGIENLYTITDRATRDLRFGGDILLPPAPKVKPERLPRRERSIMMTLDKILRNPNST